MEYFTNIYNILHNTISHTVDVVIELFTFESLYASIITGFLFFSKMATYAKIKTSQIYQNYPLANTIAERMGHFKKMIYSTLYNYRIEPNESHWTNITSIVYIKDMNCSKENHDGCQDVNCGMTKYKTEEIYKFIPENVSDEDKLNYYSLRFLDAKTTKLRKDTPEVDLFTMKMGNSYIIRNISNSTQSKSRCFDTKLSKTRFISILYSHPKLKNPVYIELPKGMYLVGNELLSPAFVLRYLEHQSMPYVFDMNYTLNIIDNHIQQFNLNSSQYVLLTERGYLTAGSEATSGRI